MPQVLWSEWATDDFVRIIGFIQIDNPIAAERLRKTIEKSAMQLVYKVYQTNPQQTVILRILHARQAYL